MQSVSQDVGKICTVGLKYVEVASRITMGNLGSVLGTNNTSSTGRQANNEESRMALPSNTSPGTGITSLINAFRKTHLEMVMAIEGISIKRCFCLSKNV